MAYQLISSSTSFLLCLLIVPFALQSRFCSGTIIEKEKTLAMIKPDGLSGNYTEKIRSLILQSNFSIIREMITQLDEETSSKFYAEHSSRSFFSSLIEYMTSGPVLIMVLEKENAVVDWRNLIGPTDPRKAIISHPHSIRAMCGLDLQKNCVHGSDSRESAQREISFFFKEITPGELAIQRDEL